MSSMQPAVIPPKLDTDLTNIGTDNLAKVTPPTDAKQNSFWRPLLIGNRMRTTSEDNADAFDAFPALGSILDDSNEQPARGRKMSISEMFLGNTGRRVSVESVGSTEAEEKMPITENAKFKEFLKRQRQMVEDQA